MAWWWYLAMIATVLTTVIEIVYLVRKKTYRSRRVAGLCVLGYLLSLFVIIIWWNGIEIYLIRTGLFLCLGLVALLLLHIADIIADCRQS